MTARRVVWVGTWAADDKGVLTLPSGRRVRGRSLRAGLNAGLQPEFGVYLLGEDPGSMAWPSRWLRWSDFRLPVDGEDADAAISEAWRRAVDERVEIACAGGRGRTGTALACMAVLDGVPPRDAVAFVRSGYHPRAVETPWQRWYVRRFRAAR
ncbi:MAG: protein phosphatase [Actinomycetota bacterium]|nr:protein phosphatase [Actinomycetota bacterium]